MYATGRGVQGKGVRVKDNAPIMVHTEGAGPAEVSGTLVGPTGVNNISEPAVATNIYTGSGNLCIG